MVAQYQYARAGQTEPAPFASSAPNGGSAVVLIADDSEADRFFLLRAFVASGVKNPMHMLSSGAEVLEYFMGHGKFQNRALYPMPRIVILDLQMPPPNGFEILRWHQARPDLGSILWVAMSQFNSVRSISEAYAAGASTFLAKPLQAEDIRNLVQAFEDFWLVTSSASEFGPQP